MLVFIALAIVTLAAAFPLALGLLVFTHPGLVRDFLLGFAATAVRHYSEVSIRIAVAAGLLVAAPHMAGSTVVFALGWVLLVTSLVMLVVPWRAHSAFAQRVVPRALAHLPAIWTRIRCQRRSLAVGGAWRGRCLTPRSS